MIEATCLENRCMAATCLLTSLRARAREAQSDCERERKSENVQIVSVSYLMTIIDC